MSKRARTEKVSKKGKVKPAIHAFIGRRDDWRIMKTTEPIVVSFDANSTPFGEKIFDGLCKMIEIRQDDATIQMVLNEFLGKNLFPHSLPFSLPMKLDDEGRVIVDEDCPYDDEIVGFIQESVSLLPFDEMTKEDYGTWTDTQLVNMWEFKCSTFSSFYIGDFRRK